MFLETSDAASDQERQPFRAVRPDPGQIVPVGYRGVDDRVLQARPAACSEPGGSVRCH